MEALCGLIACWSMRTYAPMTEPALSEPMREAMIMLARDWPWGVETRTARALVRRGLATAFLHQPVIDGRVATFELLRLTDLGRPIAEDLDRRDRAAAGARPIPGTSWELVEGGRADA